MKLACVETNFDFFSKSTSMAAVFAIILVLLVVCNAGTDQLRTNGHNVTIYVGHQQYICYPEITSNTWNRRTHIIDSHQHRQSQRSLNIIFRELVPWVYYDKKQRPIGFLVELWSVSLYAFTYLLEQYSNKYPGGKWRK